MPSSLTPPFFDSSKKLLLVVEDSEEDYEVFLRSVKKSDVDCYIFRCETGEEAWDFLNNEKVSDGLPLPVLPSMILLDLNLPGMDGQTILSKIKSDPKLKLIPVIIFSTSSSSKDIQSCYENGANAYVVKPMDILKIRDHINILLKHWLEVNVYDSNFL
ncbi:MAG: response regulator [Limnothrix sp.]